MKLTGTVPFTAPQTAVWQLLTDPDRLCTCLPGLQQWHRLAEHHFQLQLAWQFGPNGHQPLPIPVTIEWTRLQPPRQLLITAVIHLNRLPVTVNGRFNLTAHSETTTGLHFSATIDTPNPIIEQIIRNLAPRLIDNYFICLRAKLPNQANG